MAEYTGPMVDAPVNAISAAKQTINPALPAALLNQNAPVVQSNQSQLVPSDARSLALSQANRLEAEKLKIREEARQQAIKQVDEARRLQMESEKADQKKAKNLESLTDLIPRAKSILKGEGVDATGAPIKTALPTQSLGGSIIDTVGAFIGKTPPGAGAADRLKVIGGAMVLAMPRMEGPQSDADVKLYREMAGRVGDDTISVQRRLDALDEVERIYSKYGKTAEVKAGNKPPAGAPPEAKQAADGKWYSPDPARKGKYLMWGQ